MRRGHSPMTSRLSVTSSRHTKDERIDVTAFTWRKDSEARSCENCRTMFTFFKRRHHCRLCGGIFCNQCSQERLQLACAPEPQRACVNCYRKHSVDTPLRDLQIQECDCRRKLISEWKHLHMSGLFDMATSAHAEAIRQQWRIRNPKPQMIGVQVQGEAQVQAVSAGSAAARAGLRSGDRLLMVGERTVQCSADLLRAEDSLRPGDSVSVLVRTLEGENRAIDLHIEPSEGVSTEVTSATGSPQSPDCPAQMPLPAVEAHS